MQEHFTSNPEKTEQYQSGQGPVPKPDSSALRPFIDEGLGVLPLHRPEARRTIEKTDGTKKVQLKGKTPLHKDWVKKRYRPEKVIEHMDGGGNVGIQLPPEIVVVDVDPRHFAEGDDPLARLAKDYDLDLDNAPTVITGSGGKHIYFTKPADIKVQNGLEGYDGIEFKSHGRQVVAPGSIHPETMKPYKWDVMNDDLSARQPLSPSLLECIESVQSTSGGEPGEYTPEQIEAMLVSMRPEHFDSNDAWEPLMMAVHQASGGMAGEEFVAWSTQDPDYSDDAEMIRIRWDSLSVATSGAKRGGGTLRQLVIKHGDQETIPRDSAKKDFAGVILDEEHDKIMADADQPVEKRPIDRAIEEWYYVAEKTAIVVHQEHGKGSEANEIIWQERTQESARAMWANKPSIMMNGRMVSFYDAWLSHPKRRTIMGFDFDPTKPTFIQKGPGDIRINEWRGWKVKPKQGGDWSMLRQMVWDVFCDERKEIEEYIWNWVAFLFQHPEKRAEVALCMKGGKGIGKGTLANVILHICGQHGTKLDHPDQLTKKFNAHLHKKVFVFSDEAIHLGRKTVEGTLKSLLTEPTLLIEPKGRDSFSAKNFMHLMMASNADWVVPVDLRGERRFCVLEGTTRYQGDHAFWDDLHKQLDAGGYEAFLHDMLARDIRNWSPRQGIPHTRAFEEQGLFNLDGAAEFWLEALKEGSLPGYDGEEAWEVDQVLVEKDAFRAEYRDYMGTHRKNESVLTDSKLTTRLKEICPRIDDRAKTSGTLRQQAYRFPNLEECRSEMSKALGHDIDFK